MFDWEEGLFTGARNLYRSVYSRVNPDVSTQHRVELKTIRHSLFVFSHLISGKPVKIFETNEFVLCQGQKICLPESIQWYNDKNLNSKLYYFKTGLAAWVISQASVIQKRKINVQILNQFFMEYPGFRDHFTELDKNFFPQTNNNHIKTSRKKKLETQNFQLLDWIGDQVPGKRDDDILKVSLPDLEQQEGLTKQEVKGKGQLDVERLEESSDAKKEMPFHSFEKVETIDEYEGVDRTSENDNDLKDNEEALKELNLKHVIRTKEQTSSIYNAELSLNGTTLEINSGSSGGIPYPEWNFKKKCYRENWCCVKPGIVQANDSGRAWALSAPQLYRAQVHRIKRKLLNIQSQIQRRKSQSDGEEFDMEALLDAQLDILNGKSPTENIYENKTHSPLDAHLHFILDVSFSSEGYINGEMILDVLKRSVYILSMGLEELIESFEISAFYSDTRKNCYYLPVKSVNHSIKFALETLGSLEPSGYTRIGPALRHTYSLMKKIASPRKSVILLSDGKPNDYDRYEGHYGIQDVRKAIQEGQLEGIHTFALAFDERASEHLPQMFRQNMFVRVNKPDSLITAASLLAMRIKYGV